jgi:hypothetical protein
MKKTCLPQHQTTHVETNKIDTKFSATWHPTLKIQNI